MSEPGHLRVRLAPGIPHALGVSLHRDVTLSQLRDPSLSKRIEQQAHLFAGAFLFPRESFRQEVAAPTLNYFSALKKRWGMSIAAMIYRASVLGMIDEFEKVEEADAATMAGTSPRAV